MRRLNYNIAEKRVFDRKFLLVTSGVLLLFSFFAVFAGIFMIAKTGNIRSESEMEFQRIENNLKTLEKKREDFDRNIQELKKQWLSRVNMSNHLVSRHINSPLSLMNRLETELPVDIAVEEIRFSEKSGLQADLVLKSRKMESLVLFYKTLPLQSMNILKRSKDDGYYRVKLKYGRKNEKK